jgi:inner membrane protein
VVAFKMGIPYAASFGHRGFSHSLMLAFLFALVCSAGFRYFKIPPDVQIPEIQSID